MKTLHEMEKDALLKELKKYNHSLSETAKAIGISSQSLYKRLYIHGIVGYENQYKLEITR